MRCLVSFITYVSTCEESVFRVLIKDGGWWSERVPARSLRGRVRKSVCVCECVWRKEREVMKMKGLAGEKWVILQLTGLTIPRTNTMQIGFYTMLSGRAWSSNLARPQWELEANNSRQCFTHKEPYVQPKWAGKQVHRNCVELLCRVSPNKVNHFSDVSTNWTKCLGKMRCNKTINVMRWNINRLWSKTLWSVFLSTKTTS